MFGKIKMYLISIFCSMNLLRKLEKLTRYKFVSEAKSLLKIYLKGNILINQDLSLE